jgi:hypothetical protein
MMLLATCLCCALEGGIPPPYQHLCRRDPSEWEAVVSPAEWAKDGSRIHWTETEALFVNV